MGKNNILELDHKCQNTTRSGSFIDMLEHTKRSMKVLYKTKKQILCSQHILANYFENKSINDIVVIIDLKLRLYEYKIIPGSENGDECYMHKLYQFAWLI